MDYKGKIKCSCGEDPYESRESQVYLDEGKKTLRVVCGFCGVETTWSVDTATSSVPVFISKKEVYK